MSLVWAEPFDQYGAANPVSNGFFGQFGYVDSAFTGWSTPGRTGARAYWLQNAGVLRRALNNTFTTGGQGSAFNLQLVPTLSTYQNIGYHFESAGKVHEVSFVALMDLSIGIFDRTGTLVGKTSANKLITNSYQWIECKVICNTAGVNTGTAICRIQGNTEVTVNGINLPNAIAYPSLQSNGNPYGGAFFDDWIVWDNAGTKNNDFMGDRRLIASFPNANGVTQNFTASAGSAFNCVNQVPPVDTTFIDGAVAGNISEFTKTAIGIAANDIAAAVIIGRLFKTDAGVASARIGINSSAVVSNSAELFPGTTGSWFQFFQELDPNGNIPWTQAAYDAALLRITRVQ